MKGDGREGKGREWRMRKRVRWKYEY